jgi:hypothetical protein
MKRQQIFVHHLDITIPLSKKILYIIRSECVNANDKITAWPS